MPANTPKYALPYPLGTDLIANGDDMIKALAERVEAVLGPTSAAVAYSANAIDAYEGSRFYKSGGLVILKVGVRLNAAFGAGAAFLTAPAGFRPAVNARAVVWDVTAGTWAVGSFVPLTVEAVGGLTYFDAAVATAHSLVGTVVYPIP